MPSLYVTTLTGRHVTLEPARPDHAEALAACAAEDRSTFQFTAVPAGLDETRAYLATLLDDAEHGRAAPFVQIRRSDGAIVGCTRYLHPCWPLGRHDPDEVEIGGTWLSAGAQRTAINTEAKLLLLTHAFDVWGAQRVAICTDARNERSRRAIERIGATCEGVLRRHRLSTAPGSGATLRDTASYSIIVQEWPDIRRALEARLMDGAYPSL